MAGDKSLILEGVVKARESINDVTHNYILYDIESSLLYNEGGGPGEDWKVPTSTTDQEVALPLGVSSATGVIIRIKKKPGASDYIKVRFNSNGGTQFKVGSLLILLETNITKLFVTNDSGSVVDTKIQFVGD